MTTYTVKATGGDYATLALAEAGVNDATDYTAVSHIIECYSSVTADGRVVVDGGTNQSASNKLTITCPSGEGHAGTRGGGYYLESNTGSVLTLSDPYVVVKGLEIRSTESGAGFEDGVNITANNCRLDQCIVEGGTGSNSSAVRCAASATGHEIWRSALFGGASSHGGIYDSATNTGNTLQLLNTSIYDTNSSASGVVNRRTWDCRNTVVAGFTADFTVNGGLWAAASEYNASSDTSASSVDATNYQNSLTVADEFTNAASYDLSIKESTSAALLGNGVNLSSIFGDSFDITGVNQYGTNWDIGAYAATAVSGAAVVIGPGTEITASGDSSPTPVFGTAEIIGQGSQIVIVGDSGVPAVNNKGGFISNIGGMM